MKTRLLVGIGLMIALLLGLVGCEGISGPRGETGDPGDTGQPWQAQPPANRFFSLAVCNGQIVDHNGAAKLYLSFDGEHQNAGDTVVSYRLADGQVPTIDGIDEGESGWGGVANTVVMQKAAGSDNFITAATVRSAWDESYIYFQVKWTEVTNEAYGVTAGESTTPERWYTPSNLLDLGAGWARAKAWELTQSNEDFLLMMFEIGSTKWFDRDGCYVTCHAGTAGTNFHHTNFVRERMDTWMWSAGLTQPTGFAADRYFDSDTDPLLSLSWDVGTPSYRVNDQTVRFEFGDNDSSTTFPLYQHANDPNYDAPYPFWDYEMVTETNNVDWQAGSSVPRYYSSIPFGSTADVTAFGHYDSDTNTWTVELKRRLVTGNGDDAQF